MIPRAALVDTRPLAASRHAVRSLAWWRSPSPGVFLVGHAATAGALQLAALIVDLARAGRPSPAAPALFSLWLGLAMVATIPAMITMLARMLSPHRGTQAGVIRAAAIGVGFYAVLPVLMLAGAVGPIAVLIPVAVLWHVALAAAPVPRL